MTAPGNINSVQRQPRGEEITDRNEANHVKSVQQGLRHPQCFHWEPRLNVPWHMGIDLPSSTGMGLLPFLPTCLCTATPAQDHETTGLGRSFQLISSCSKFNENHGSI